MQSRKYELPARLPFLQVLDCRDGYRGLLHRSIGRNVRPHSTRVLFYTHLPAKSNRPGRCECPSFSFARRAREMRAPWCATRAFAPVAHRLCRDPSPRRHICWNYIFMPGDALATVDRAAQLRRISNCFCCACANYSTASLPSSCTCIVNALQLQCHCQIRICQPLLVARKRGSFSEGNTVSQPAISTNTTADAIGLARLSIPHGENASTSTAPRAVVAAASKMELRSRGLGASSTAPPASPPN